MIKCYPLFHIKLHAMKTKMPKRTNQEKTDSPKKQKFTSNKRAEKNQTMEKFAGNYWKKT